MFPVGVVKTISLQCLTPIELSTESFSCTLFSDLLWDEKKKASHLQHDMSSP